MKPNFVVASTLVVSMLLAVKLMAGDSLAPSQRIPGHPAQLLDLSTEAPSGWIRGTAIEPNYWIAVSAATTSEGATPAYASLQGVSTEDPKARQLKLDLQEHRINAGAVVDGLKVLAVKDADRCYELELSGDPETTGSPLEAVSPPPKANAQSARWQTWCFGELWITSLLEKGPERLPAATRAELLDAARSVAFGWPTPAETPDPTGGGTE